MSDIDGDPHCIACPRREAQDAEIERLKAALARQTVHWEHQNGLLEAEIERLQTTLREIAGHRDETGWGETYSAQVARIALEKNP